MTQFLIEEAAFLAVAFQEANQRSGPSPLEPMDESPAARHARMMRELKG